MPVSEVEILVEAERWARAGRKIALATVVETWGSAPRPRGASLVIDADCAFIGSVSGGCVEGEVVAEAQEILREGGARLLDFGVADETAWRAGLSCGGRISVLVRPLELSLLAAINAAQRERRSCALVAGLVSGAQCVVAAGSSIPEPYGADIRPLIAEGASARLEGGPEPVFVAVFSPSPRLVMIGAVHIAQALAPMARLAGFEPVVIDPRTAFASTARFDGARLIAQWPKDALATLGLDEGAAVALLTHEPRIDDEAAIEALNSRCFYIGALGSKVTHARRLERLRAAGFSESALDRIHAPIGLDIGAKSPAEIAVAILAEIVAALRRGRAGENDALAPDPSAGRRRRSEAA